MAIHERFHYKTFEEMLKNIEELKLDIPYNTFSRGGAGLLWFEATAVVREGRANPRQLWIHNKNVHSFEKLVNMSRKSASESLGSKHKPLMILQITHSGRYSKPSGKPEPIIAQHSGILDKLHNLPEDYPIISDDELDKLKEKYLEAAHLAKKAGFDGVDIKSCHGYLLIELLGSFTRKNSRYGGSFENRSRFLLEVVEDIKNELPELIVTSRLNVFDAYAYPYGFGIDKEDYLKPDLSEPILLIEKLKKLGVPGINVAIGNPYYNPHYERPYDTAIAEGYMPDEHPLENISRSIQIARQIKENHSDMTIIGSGFSWIRQYFPYIAAGMIKNNCVSMVGVGRMAFAYPDFAKDILEKGFLEPTKVCIACSGCSQIMKDGGRTGCVVRDAEIYSPIYKEGRYGNQEIARKLAEICRNCINPTCVEGCPADVDIPGFISAIAEKNEKESYSILRKSNMLPEMCAYICPVEVQCEKGCIQRYLGDGPVKINLLQRYVAERARKQGWASVSIPDKVIDKNVAVIGAGPSGLACAIRLLELGYKVTIFDKENKPGGIVTYTYPEHKIPEEAIDEEIKSIFSKAENKQLFWKFGKEIDADYNLDNIIQDGFDAVYIAIGLMRSVPLPNSIRPKKGVIDVLSFLRRMKFNNNIEIPSQVAVLGGGNSAIDAAVVSKNAGARDVYIIYRRSFEEIPAFPQERDKALNEGIQFLIMTQPLDYKIDENGILTGVKVAPTRLGEPDQSGRRSPQIIPDTKYTVEVNLVIEALGQKSLENISHIFPGINFSKNGLIITKKGSTATEREGVFAGGDAVNGGTTAVQAVADGRSAAEEINRLFLAFCY